mgnify:CR=1 FL=1
MKNLSIVRLKIFFIFITISSLNATSMEVLEVRMLDSYSITKEFPGKLLPVQQSKLSFQISGKVNDIYVDVGDVVKKGDILAKLDDREALARLNQAKASYDLSKQVLDRFVDLRQKGHISIQDLDRAKSDFTISKSQFEFYKVKLEQTNLISPFDAVIQSRFLDIGSVINSGVSILEIIDSKYVEAHISLPVIFLNDMQIGKLYNFDVNGEIFQASFSRIAPMSPGGSNSRLAIFKFSDLLNPGSITNLKLKVIKKSRGTWVPLKSLSQSDEGLWAIYTIDEQKEIVRDLVEIIYFEDEYAYVNGTINNGDLVILGGASKIIAGKKINL